jgi:NNP family nitrate/nitrite transporter-like MFS transporter
MDSAESAWRTVCIVPAVVTFTTGVALFFIAEDAPKGNYTEMKKYGNMPEISATASFRQGAINFNSWLLFIQYAACFGVELTMNNAAALYFTDEFGQSTESAAAIASLFGWMNLFARGTGGYLSDKLNAKMGMRGRLWVQALLLIGEGVMVLIFAEMKSLAGAIVVMVIFSLFVQAAEGSTFGVVPYVDPPSTGSISGIVGAGGNVGAVCFGLCFRQLEYKLAFLIMGFVILGSGVITIFLKIKGHAQLLWGKDTPLAMKSRTLTIPEPAYEMGEEVNQDVKKSTGKGVPEPDA